MTATVLLLDSSGAKLPPLADVFITGENRADPFTGQKRDFLLTVPNVAENIMPWGWAFLFFRRPKSPPRIYSWRSNNTFWIFLVFFMFMF